MFWKWNGDHPIVDAQMSFWWMNHIVRQFKYSKCSTNLKLAAVLWKLNKQEPFQTAHLTEQGPFSLLVEWAISCSTVDSITQQRISHVFQKKNQMFRFKMHQKSDNWLKFNFKLECSICAEWCIAAKEESLEPKFLCLLQTWGHVSCHWVMHLQTQHVLKVRLFFLCIHHSISKIPFFFLSAQLPFWLFLLQLFHFFLVGDFCWCSCVMHLHFCHVSLCAPSALPCTSLPSGLQSDLKPRSRNLESGMCPFSRNVSSKFGNKVSTSSQSSSVILPQHVANMHFKFTSTCPCCWHCPWNTGRKINWCSLFIIWHVQNPFAAKLSEFHHQRFFSKDSFPLMHLCLFLLHVAEISSLFHSCASDVLLKVCLWSQITAVEVNHHHTN